MGCDIHLHVEKKVNGKWVEVPDVGYDNRNYKVFAILANVRNGYGFAGCPTGRGFKSISEPKGLPDDASKEVKEHSESWGVDGHSHSYLTLKELEAYDWDQVTWLQGVINANEYLVFKKEGRPRGWSGGVFGANVRNISQEQMEAEIKAGTADCNTYCSVEWRVTYRECAQHFIEDMFPKMRALGKPENVRIVFWFDN